MNFVNNPKVKVELCELLSVAASERNAGATSAWAKAKETWNRWLKCWFFASSLECTTSDTSVARWNGVPAPSRAHRHYLIPSHSRRRDLCSIVDVHAVSKLNPLRISDKLQWVCLKASLTTRFVFGQRAQSVLVPATMICLNAPCNFRFRSSNPCGLGEDLLIEWIF